MDKLRYALVGCGRIAPNHIGAVMANAEALDFVAACDLDGTANDHTLAAYPARDSVWRYMDHREMPSESFKRFSENLVEEQYDMLIWTILIMRGDEMENMIFRISTIKI